MSKFVTYESVIGGVTIKQVARTAYRSGANVVRQGASGAKVASLVAVQNADPRVTIDSFDLKGVLDGIPITKAAPGLSVAAGTITIPYNKRKNGGVFETGANHFELAGTDGLAVVRTISAGQDDAGAQCSLELALISTDGVTDPVTENNNVSLAASSFQATHALGKVVANSTTLNRITNVSVDTGLTIQIGRSSALAYPDIAFIETLFEPTIDVTFEDISHLATFDSILTALTDIQVYFRKRADGGIFVADATAQHVKVEFASGGAGVITCEDVTGSENDDGTVTLRFHGDEFTVSTAIAIP